MALHGMVELALKKIWHYVAAGSAVYVKTKSITVHIKRKRFKASTGIMPKYS